MKQQRQPKRISNHPVSIGCLIIGIVTFCLVFIINALLQPHVLDPFSPYPNGKLLAASSESNIYPTGISHYLQCLPDPFFVKNWQVFGTADNLETIHKFYSQQSSKMPKILEEYYGTTPFNASDREPSQALTNVFCYTDEGNQKYRPTNIVIILDPQHSEDLQVINQAVPNTASNQNVIISLQGIIPRG